MSDSLRTRIIAALLSEDDVALMADAVIRELRLTPEHSYGTTYPNVPVEDRRLIRYVTEWTEREQ